MSIFRNISATFEYIKSDLYRYTGKVSFLLFLFHFFYNRGFIYTFWLRLAQSDIMYLKHISTFNLKLKSWKYGIQISPKVKIGYGFYIGHGMSVIINPNTIIGNNVNVSQFLSIGSTSPKAATIGDNVYIGPNVCIVGEVIIGSNCNIGAGAVVTKNFSNNKVIVGVPAKAIKDCTATFVGNHWKKS